VACGAILDLEATERELAGEHSLGDAGAPAAGWSDLNNLILAIAHHEHLERPTQQTPRIGLEVRCSKHWAVERRELQVDASELRAVPVCWYGLAREPMLDLIWRRSTRCRRSLTRRTRFRPWLPHREK
jgi:hypothetical protein